MLSNYPDWFLINYQPVKHIWRFGDDHQSPKQYVTTLPISQELDLRQPNEAIFFFGDCEGKQVFLPIEEYDSNGKKIVTELIGYDNEGNEVWNEI